MKPTIITLLLLMAVGCGYMKTPLVITKVQIDDTGCSTKYMVTVNDLSMFHTDSLYQVGDTIK